MTLLAPFAAITAALISIPALLLMYFLKLRRAPRRIPSTLLWLKSIEDLQVNAPFQRLRITVLFLLQLLMLLLIILAIGQPVIDARSSSGARTIVIIDRSASMNAIDTPSAGNVQGVTRLDRAIQSARAIVNTVGEPSGPDQIMLITFATSAQVLSPFQSDRRWLLDALQTITPTDEAADLAAALALADAYASSSEGDERPPDVILLSDGSAQTASAETDASLLRVRANTFEFAQVVPAGLDGANNLGIVALSARRQLDDPSNVGVFVRVLSAHAEAREASLTLRRDGEPFERVKIRVPGNPQDRSPATNLDGVSEVMRGEASHTFDIVIPDDAVLSVDLAEADALMSDNVASIIMPAPRQPRLAVLTDGSQPDVFLMSVLDAMAPESTRTMSLEDYLANWKDSGAFDLLVFDRVTPVEAPRVPTLSVGAAMPPIDREVATDERGRRVLSWQRRHPLMRHVELENLIYSNAGAYIIPDDLSNLATVLASGANGPVMVTYDDETSDLPHVMIAFDLLHSNWPTDVSLLIFLQNVIDRAMGASPGGTSGRDGLAFHPGEPIVVAPRPASRTLQITGAHNFSTSIETENRTSVTLPVVRRVGLYFVDGARPPFEAVAVNLTNAGESNIRPSKTVTVNATQVGARSSDTTAAKPLWPWLVAAAFVLMMIEWIVYLRRVSLA